MTPETELLDFPMALLFLFFFEDDNFTVDKQLYKPQKRVFVKTPPPANKNPPDFSMFVVDYMPGKQRFVDYGGFDLSKVRFVTERVGAHVCNRPPPPSDEHPP